MTASGDDEKALKVALPPIPDGSFWNTCKAFQLTGL